MQKIDGKMMSFVIDFKTLEKVDRVAAKAGKTRSETIRSLLSFGCDIYGDFEKVGIVSLASVITKALEKVHGKKGQLKLF